MSNNILGILGQVIPAGVLTTLYTVPANTTVSLSSLFVSNPNASSTTFSVSIASQGAADNASQYIYQNIVMDGQDTFTCWFQLSLVGGDVVRCNAGNSNLTFSLFGASV